MRENVIRDKSYSFALRIVNLARYLKTKKVESVLLNQILKSGTSIAANVEEAVASISKAEFSSKISISFKEARETHFWLRLLKDTGSISQNEFDSLITDCEEILKILWGILKNTRMKKNEE
jgi:four helix bundle protein